MMTAPIATTPAVTPKPCPEAATMRTLAAQARAVDLDKVADNIARAAALLEGPDAWAAYPLLRRLYGDALGDLRRARKNRDRWTATCREPVARLYLAAVLVVRPLPRAWPEMAIEAVDWPHAIGRWFVTTEGGFDNASRPWRGGQVLVERFPDGRLYVQLDVSFIGGGYLRFGRGAKRGQDAMAMRRGRRWAALAAALLRAPAVE
jgi:hypothetical protein